MASSHSSELEDDEVTFHPRHTVRRSPSLYGSPVYDVTSSGPTLDDVRLVTDSHDYNPLTVSHQYALRSRGCTSEQGQATSRPSFDQHTRRVETIVKQVASDDLHVAYATDNDDRQFKFPILLNSI